MEQTKKLAARAREAPRKPDGFGTLKALSVYNCGIEEQEPESTCCHGRRRSEKLSPSSTEKPSRVVRRPGGVLYERFLSEDAVLSQITTRKEVGGHQATFSKFSTGEAGEPALPSTLHRAQWLQADWGHQQG